MNDYKEICKKFRWKVPKYFNWAFDVVDKLAKDKTKLAMVWVDDSGMEKKLTFLDFKVMSNKFANALESLGLKKGDKLLLMLPNIPELWDVELGCMKKGVVYIPSTTLLTPKDLEFRFNTARAKVVVTNSENAGKIDEIKAKCPSLKSCILVDGKRDGWLSWEKLMATASNNFTPAEKTKSYDSHVIYFTSGTTGLPKMVLHTNVSYPIGHVVTGRFWINIKPTDLHWNISSAGWAKHAWSNVYGPWNAGAAVFVYNYSGGFDAVRHLELLDKYAITTFCAVPTIWRMFVLQDLNRYDFSSLRECVSAGEPLSPEIISIWKEHAGITIREGYGQTETVCLIANFPGIKVKPGSMGKSSPGFYVTVVDEKRKEVVGKEGDIVVKIKPKRPVGIFKEYLENPEKTKDSFRGKWYYTGDRAIKDKDGYIWFIGRADDVIKSSGYRIGPFEVESALQEHPAVAESAVVASPHPIRGVIVKAFIVLKSGHEPSEQLARDIVEFTKKSTAPYKHPRAIEFVEKLPKTVSGKIRRVELRDLEIQRHHPAKEGKTVPPLGKEYRDL